MDVQNRQRLNFPQVNKLRSNSRAKTRPRAFVTSNAEKDEDVVRLANGFCYYGMMTRHILEYGVHAFMDEHN